MAKYTIELRTICESLAGLSEHAGYEGVSKVVELARPQIFSFDYPIFDKEYKSVLETKILNHFYTREIGFETYGDFKRRLDVKMNEIMPYYNQLYLSAKMEFDPFKDTEFTREHKGKNEGNETFNKEGNYTNKNNGNNSAESTTIDTYSDTPQGALTGLLADEYLTNASQGRNNGKGETHSEGNGTTKENNKTEKKTLDEYLETVKGKVNSRSYSDLLMEYRKTFLNIDLKVINELNDLFMLLW